jgi:uncharacterized protein
VRFVCDDNLGKLAKYLRILGFDTFFQEIIDDAALLRIAASEERFILTRDHNLLGKSNPFGTLIIEIDYPKDQLRLVIQTLGLKIHTEQFFRRCSRCNELCAEVDKNQISNNIYPFILKTQDIINQCPSCKRFYWKGTHYKKLLAEFRNLIPQNAIVGAWPNV